MMISRTLLNVASVIIFMLVVDVKVRHHSHITGKYKGSSYKDCNINVELNKKNPCHISKPKKL